MVSMNSLQQRCGLPKRYAAAREEEKEGPARRAPDGAHEGRDQGADARGARARDLHRRATSRATHASSAI